MVVQQTLTDPHPALGESSSDLRSQITEEHPSRAVGNFPDTPLADIWRNASVVELVQDTGVIDAAASIVATTTNTTLVGNNYPWPSKIN